MKKFKLAFAALFCSLAIILPAQPIINILTEFYSESLDEYRNVRIYLPGDYNTPPANMHYPVIYFLHGWTANHNSISTMLSTLQNLMDSGAIEPVIMVAADNWVEPFAGSVYVNSILWGDYEDYNVNDLVDWIDANYRTIPAPEGRALIGHSMGGFGAFRYGLLHKDKFCAFAANAATVNFDLFIDHIQTQIQIENSGPPYFYSFSNSGEFTQFAFVSAGAFSPNYNTPQTYIDPAIVEYPLDENGNLIDSVYQKFKIFDVLEPLHATTPQDSVGILFCCGTNDEWGLYQANAALSDTLDALGLPCEFMSHTGGHTITAAFKQRALMFLDSLLVSPAIPCSCLPEGITFTTQQQIDNFQTNYPGCTEIEGDVKINGTNITNLNGLNVLTVIGGDLSIKSNDALTNLIGLENLTFVGGCLEIYNNDALTNLSELDNLASTGALIIWYNSALNSLMGMENLVTIGGIRIEKNDALTSLTGLDNLTTIGYSINIINNSSLSSCDADWLCECMAAPTGQKNIYGNAIGCQSEIDVALACGGMPCLPAGNYHFQSQADIDNFQFAFPDCSQLQGEVSISGSDIMDLSGLNLVTAITGDLLISDNNLLTCLTGLENLTSIGVNLTINNNDSLNSLTGLESVTDIYGNIEITSNTTLTDLTGLDNLSSIGGDLKIGGNYSLSNLSGLENLNFIGGSLNIGYIAYIFPVGNPALTSLIGLNNLTSIEGSLSIVYSDSLTSLSGLENLTSIYGNLSIGANISLISLIGLNNLGSIGGGLSFHSNYALTSLTGLENLTNIGGSLMIEENISLTSLEGLDNIDAGSITHLLIRYNDSLSTCEVQSICDYLAAPNGTVTISNNAPGCNNHAQVLEACEAVSVQEAVSEEETIGFSPNPFTEQLTIELHLQRPGMVSAALFNQLGQKQAVLFEKQFPAGEHMIPCTAGCLQPGIYLLRLQAAEEIIVQKVIRH